MDIFGCIIAKEIHKTPFLVCTFGVLGISYCSAVQRTAEQQETPKSVIIGLLGLGPQGKLEGNPVKIAVGWQGARAIAHINNPSFQL
jgi:hypothetical protein